MKVILSGHEETKKVLGISSFLVDKYLPKSFDIYWLNFGEYTGKLFRGKYIELGKTQEGGAQSWSKYLREYLSGLTDDIIILGLDDYLINKPIDKKKYTLLWVNIALIGFVCAKLCTSNFHKPSEYDMLEGSIMLLNNTAEYSVVAQYCIWDRECLIDILNHCTTPWSFEIEGSKYLNASGKKVIGTKEPTINYFDSGSVSRHWEGINTKGVNSRDLHAFYG